MYLVGRASEFFTLSVQTTSTVFPTPSSPSLQDMTYVAKIHSTYDAQGHAQQPVLDYISYFAGGDSTSSGATFGFSIAVDSTNTAYITGRTNSPLFPTKHSPRIASNNIDAFVTKLHPDGNDLIYSMVFGGDGVERSFGIALEPNPPSGEQIAYVTGYTESPNILSWPVCNVCTATQGAAFVAKVVSTASTFTLSHVAMLGASDSVLGRT